VLHVIGDSHGSYAFRGIGEFHSIGNLLMYQAGLEGYLQQTVSGLDLHPDDVLLVSCGEIDVRCCIIQQVRDQGVDYATVLRRIVDPYLDLLLKLDAKGAPVAVLSVSPPAPGERGKPRHADVTDEQRLDYTNTLNDLLREGCTARGIPFVDTHTEAVGPDGMLPLAISDGWTHITDTGITKRALTRLGLMKGE
jgi:hypothetical protein